MQKTFSFETRLEVIKLHEEGNLSPAAIAKEIGTCHSVVERWLELYKYNGIEGLRIKDYHQQYDDDLKSKVIGQVTVQNIPYTKVAAMNNLSPSTVKRWVVQSTKGLKLSGKKNLITSEEAAAIREKFKHVKDPEIRKIMEKNYWLEMENEALKKIGSLNPGSTKEKAIAVSELRQKYKLKDLLLVFNMKRSTYYAAVQDKPDKYESEKELIKYIFHHHKGRYGYRRITRMVRRAGFMLNHKTVKRLMAELGLRSCVRPKKYHSYKGIEGKGFPNVLQRNFKASGFNEKWVTDVTEFNICGQRVYLSALIDLYNQEVISYTVSHRPTLNFVCIMLSNVFERYDNLTGLIIHSDHGWHYRTERYTQMLKMKGVTQSMSRKGNCLDNCMAENFFGLLKTEFYYTNRFSSVEEFEKALVEYIDYYNTERIKMGLNGLSPIEFRIQNAA